MNLTDAQRDTLRSWIASNFPDAALTVDDSAPIAAALNAAADPTFWARRSWVTRREFLHGESADGTAFAWVADGYIGRSQGERAAFEAIWDEHADDPDAGLGLDPAPERVQQAVRDIFSGAPANNPNAKNNRDHFAAISRRPATVLERLLASGNGTTNSPAILAVGADGRYVEGPITPAEAYLIRAEG